MSDLKKFIVKEIANNLQKELGKKKIKESAKTLYETVTLSEKVKKSGDKNKIKMAESALKLAEKKLAENYDEYDSGCDCGEGEGRMLKAQLLSIMANAKKIFHMIDDDDQFEDWVQSKITIAEDYLRASYGYLTYYNGEGESDDSDWDDEQDSDGWDDVDEENFDSEDFDDGDMSVNMPSYVDALDANLDDDDIFEQKNN